MQEVRKMIRFFVGIAAAVALLVSASDAQAFGKRIRGGCSSGSCGSNFSTAGNCSSGSCQTAFAGNQYAVQPVQYGTFPNPSSTNITGTTVTVDGQTRPTAEMTQTKTTMPDTITINGVTYTKTK